MINKRTIIVGGVAGGASAAARLRRLDEHMEIVMFERDEYISFANCGLPYYIGEQIQERSKLLVQTPEAMKRRFNIDVRVQSEVLSIDTAKKSVTVQSKDRGRYEESFDYLILSPGATPVKPPIPGIGSKHIFTLRNIPDTDKIKSYIDEHEVKRAVIIGGGFIGIEMAENLIERGIEVAIVEAAPHILAPFDTDMVAYAEKELRDHGVQLVLGDAVEEFQEQVDDTVVKMASGNELAGELILLAIGVQPDTKFLDKSGINLGNRGHIIVNNEMETNVPGIYAVGDAVEVQHFVHGQSTAIPLAGPANKQGRIASDNICGLTSSYNGTQGTSILKIFGMTGAATGLNERSLLQEGIPYKVIHIHPASHATYYPGATPLAIKLLFDHSGRILGAQAFGEDGVDKRIDVIATTMRLGGTVHDLAELELSYAPPFSSAKDPVNMAGCTAQNVLANKLEVYTAKELSQVDLQTIQLIDVRRVKEHELGAIEESENIPIDDLRTRLHELDPSKEVWVYCQVGMRGYLASRILMQNGFKVKNLSGGYKTYSIGF